MSDRQERRENFEQQNDGQPIQNSNLQGRRWMLTINNPTFQESEQLYNMGHSDSIECLVYGAEHVDEGTQHFQIYIHFKANWRFNRLKQTFPRARIELAKKPKLACCRYCAKEGFYMAFGNVPDLTTGSRSGTRRARERAEDMAREEIVRKIRRGELRFQELSDEQLLDTKLVRAAKDASSMTQGPMRDDVYNCCFVSPTGWGKSYAIWKTFLHVASVEFGGTQEWYLDAEQEVMLFDEFCGQVRAQKMLKYLDRYPISLPIKGGHRPCYWKLIFICSNTRPDEWYMKDDPKTGLRVSSIPDEVRKALYRRIGYPNATSSGETHVYDAQFTNMDDARKEMMEIVQRLQQRIKPSDEPTDEQQQQQVDDDGIYQVLHDIIEHDKQQTQRKPDEPARAAADGMDPRLVEQINKEQQKSREDPRNPIDQDSNDVITIEDDQDSVTEVVNLNLTMASAQDPNADVPEFEIEDLDDDDTCPDPPSDMSDDDKDDDSDFE